MIVFDPQKPRGLVWLASYPKSGNTWLRTFLFALNRTIVQGAPESIDINDIDEFSANERDVAMYERHLGRPIDQAKPGEIAALRPRVQEEICRSGTGLVLMKTHSAMGFDYGHPLINRKVSAGAIYVVRNPLDVAISFAHYRDSPIDEVIADMATPGFGGLTEGHQIYFSAGTWSEHVSSWTIPPSARVLVVRYEDLLDRPIESFSAIARHVAMSPTPEQLQRAIDLTSFDRLRETETRTGFVEKPDQAARFFRAGRAGQWRDALTAAQVDRVVADHRVQMERFGYLPN